MSKAKPWFRENAWWVSPFNFDEAARGPSEASAAGRDVFVTDSTIRSICTSEPGLTVTIDGIVEIARALAEIGVRQVCFNILHTGTVSELALAACQAVTRAVPEIEARGGCTLLPDLWRQSITASAAAGARAIEVSYGAEHRAGFTGTEAVFDLLEEAVGTIQAEGFTSGVAYNVKADTDFRHLVTYVQRAIPHRPRYLRIYDTHTCLGPHGMAWLVKALRGAAGADLPPIILHTHNVWGLASATTIAGVLAGAQGIDLAVNGVGKEGGHTPFAETVLCLEALYGVNTAIDLPRIYALCKLVERVSGIPIHPNTPVSGGYVFLAEQGPAVIETLRERLGVEPKLTPFTADAVGQERRIVFGRNTLKRPVVKLKLQALGLEEPDEAAIDRALAVLDERIKELDTYPAWLEESEVDAILSTTGARG